MSALKSGQCDVMELNGEPSGLLTERRVVVGLVWCVSESVARTPSIVQLRIATGT
jgi:hypothetical protein